MEVFPSLAVSLLLYDHTTEKHLEKNLDGNSTRIALCYFELTQESAAHKTVTVQPLTFHLINYPRQTRHAVYSYMSSCGLDSVGWPAKTYIP